MLEYIIFLLTRANDIQMYDPFARENQLKVRLAKKRIVNNLLAFYDRTLCRASKLGETERSVLEQSK